jgi:hypothetical protein
MDKLNAFIDEYVRGFVKDGDDDLYVPTDDEQRLIAEAIKGLLMQPEFVAAFAARPMRVPVPKSVSDEEIVAICDRYVGHDGAIDCVGFARELLGVAMKREKTAGHTLGDDEIDRLWSRFAASADGKPDHRGFARALLDATRH